MYFFPFPRKFNIDGSFKGTVSDSSYVAFSDKVTNE
jgi:cytoskeletal protein CcmA (bactofilin family)